MLPYLIKYLSKKDACHLMDAAFRTLHGQNKEDVDAVISSLQHLIPFDRALEADLKLAGETKSALPPVPKFNGLTFGLPPEYMQQYQQGNIVSLDPVARESMQALDVVDFRLIYKKYSEVLRVPLVRQFVQEYKITNGFAYTIWTHDRTRASGLACYYRNNRVKTDRRILTIARYIVPFINELYRRVLEPEQKPVFPALTPRELEVVRWLKEGKSSWEIAMILNISERTINFHVANIMRKLNASKRTQVVVAAIKNKLIDF